MASTRSCQEFFDALCRFPTIVQAPGFGEFELEPVDCLIRCRSNASLARGQCVRRYCSYAARDLLHLTCQLIGRHSPVHEAQAKRFFAIDKLRTEYQAPGDSLAADPRQPLCAARRR
jgi:hypothetical protein